MRKRATPRANPRPALRLELLEAREVPAVLIQIDYTYDTGFFKNNPAARAVMERVASELGNMLDANLAAITPDASNSWTATFYDPATGSEVSVPNLSVAADTITVFVGARVIPGDEGGFGGPGGYILSGSTSWNSATLTRDHSGYSPWGGSITFDSSENYFFGQTTAGLTATQVDFYSVAMHEMGHLLGIGTASQWTADVSGSSFVGPAAEAVYGGPVPLSPDKAHWADGVTSGGAPTVMDPDMPRGTRIAWTALDTAALRDVGWGTAGTSPPATGPSPPVVPRVPVSSAPTVAFASGSDGTLAVYRLDGSTLTATGQRFTPFPGYRGELRIAGGDFDGDGITDYAVTTGAGGPAAVAILNGRDGSFLVAPTLPFGGYAGGLYVAAGDIDRDGRSELVLAAGQTAPPLVQTFRVSGGQLQTQSSFVAFGAPNWAGGIRVAVGDVNRDGYADVVVTTGSQFAFAAGYNGADLRNGAATQLFAFAPFGALPVGLTVAVGDMDGDGYADVALGLERGAPPFVAVWSGKALSGGSTGAPIGAFLALPVDAGGVRLVSRDLDGDGKAELIAAGGGTTPTARAFTLTQIQSGSGVSSVYPPVSGGTSGIYVG